MGSEVTAFSDFLHDTIIFLPVLLKGLGVTILLTGCSLVFSLVLGLGWALMTLSGNAWLSAISKTVVNVIRGIPIIVQLFYVYFVLPEIGVQLAPFAAGAFGLGLAYSAYQAENFRGGFEAVDRQLVEAGRSLGMSESTIFRRIIFPLGLRTALPSFGNTTVMMLKDSSIASTITIAELTRAGQLLAIATFKNGTVYTLIALLYLMASLPLAAGVRAMERKLSRR